MADVSNFCHFFHSCNPDQNMKNNWSQTAPIHGSEWHPRTYLWSSFYLIGLCTHIPKRWKLRIRWRKRSLLRVHILFIWFLGNFPTDGLGQERLHYTLGIQILPLRPEEGRRDLHQIHHAPVVHLQEVRVCHQPWKHIVKRLWNGYFFANQSVASVIHVQLADEAMWNKV